MGSGIWKWRGGQEEWDSEWDSERESAAQGGEDAVGALAPGIGVPDLCQPNRIRESQVYFLPDDGTRQGKAPQSPRDLLLISSQSCKLIPVLLLNVILYRRRFKPYKYAVVALVSAGIALFMYNGGKSTKGGKGSSVGLALLGVK